MSLFAPESLSNRKHCCFWPNPIWELWYRLGGKLRYFSNNRFPRNVPSYDNINNSPGEQYFTVSFATFPYKAIPVTPRYHTFIFPPLRPKLSLKFLLLNSVLLAAAPRRLVGAKMKGKITKHINSLCKLLI